jgi:hypothetical protein
MRDLFGCPVSLATIQRTSRFFSGKLVRGVRKALRLRSATLQLLEPTRLGCGLLVKLLLKIKAATGEAQAEGESQLEQSA